MQYLRFLGPNKIKFGEGACQVPYSLSLALVSSWPDPCVVMCISKKIAYLSSYSLPHSVEHKELLPDLAHQ
jgi:hypothetical protein